MKLAPKQLGQLIGAIVREELKRQLPGLIKECLTERYLKNIVAEQAPARRQPGLAEALGEDDDDEIPEALANSDRGIYNINKMAKGTDEEEQRQARLRPNEMVSKLLAPHNPLSFLYEGVSSSPPSADAGLPAGVPIEKMGGDFERMRELLQGMERSSTSKRGVSLPPTEERKFDPRLDTPLGGEASPRPRPRMAETARRSHPNIEGDVFPDRPIVLEE